MKSVNSYSKAFRKDITGRNWIMVAIAFIAYFLIAIVPVLMNYHSFENVEYYAEEIADGSNVLLRFVHCVLPVVMSVSCFGYLHDKAAVTTVHARPTTRVQLFHQASLQGFLLMLIPIVLIALLMLPLGGAQVSPGYENVTSPASIFTLKNSVLFIVKSGIILAVIYALSNLAAVLAGNRAIHALLAIFLNAFPVCIVALFQTVLEAMWYGYEAGFDHMKYLHPALFGFNAHDMGGWIFFVVITAVIYAVSVLAYKRVRLERVGDACYFPVIADILCIVLTFMFSVTLGMIFAALLPDDAYDGKLSFILFTLITSVIGLIVTRMIADSTTRVFNRKLLKTAGIFAVCIAIFFAVSVFDVTGYQKRIPEASQIESVEICTMFDDQYEGTWPNLSSEEAVEAVRTLHTSVVDSLQEEDENEEYMDGYVKLCYHLKNGRMLERRYSGLLLTKDHPIYDSMRALYNVPEYRESSSMTNYIEKLKKIRKRSMTFSTNYEDYISVGKDDQEALLDAFRKDYDERSFEEQFDVWRDAHNDSFNIEIENLASNTAYSSLLVSPSVDENTTKLLKEKGYF